MRFPHETITGMNLRHVGLAGLVIASVAVSACSNGAASETRSWPTPSPVSADVPVWADVSGQGVEAPRDAVDKAQFSATPQPGVKVLHDINAAGDMDMCTIGPAVSGGYLTAGHCAKAYSPVQYLQTTPTGDPHFLGTASAPVGPVDAAVIRTGAGDADATRIAGTWPVAGVLTRAGVQKLVPAGSMICIDGAVSGVRCGKRMADENQMVQFAFEAQHGDSGSPVFVVDPTTQRAALVGVVKSAGGSATDATYIEDALLATGTAVQLHRGTEAFEGPEFSGRISIQ